MSRNVGITAGIITAIGFFAFGGFIYYRSTRPQPQPIIQDRYSATCGARPADIVLTDTEFDLIAPELDRINAGKIQTSTKPRLEKVLTDAAKNSLIIDYLVCVAEVRGDIDKSDEAQIDYERRMLSFIQTGPTADQLSKWQQANPFPEHHTDLELPDFKILDGKRILEFSQVPVKTIRFINAGRVPIQVWLAHFPDKNFFPSPNPGPWEIPPEGIKTVTVIFMHAKATSDRYPFEIDVAGSAGIQAEITIDSEAAENEWYGLGRTVKAATAQNAGSSGDSVVARVKTAEEIVSAIYPAEDISAKDLIASRAFAAADDQQAALFLLKNIAQKEPTSSSNPAYFATLGFTYKALGQQSAATDAFSKYEAYVKTAPALFNAQ